MFLKKGEKVKVCVGKDKGKSGEIIEINRSRNLAKVKAVNMLKKHKKATKLGVEIVLEDEYRRRLTGAAAESSNTNEQNIVDVVIIMYLFLKKDESFQEAEHHDSHPREFL